MTNTQDRVRQVLADVFGLDIDQVHMDTSVDEIEAWDSLAHVNLILAIESEFETSIDLGSMAELTSVSRIVAEIENGDGK